MRSRLDAVKKERDEWREALRTLVPDAPDDPKECLRIATERIIALASAPCPCEGDRS